MLVLLAHCVRHCYFKPPLPVFNTGPVLKSDMLALSVVAIALVQYLPTGAPSRFWILAKYIASEIELFRRNIMDLSLSPKGWIAKYNIVHNAIRKSYTISLGHLTGK